LAIYVFGYSGFGGIRLTVQKIIKNLRLKLQKGFSFSANSLLDLPCPICSVRRYLVGVRKRKKYLPEKGRGLKSYFGDKIKNG
jgi:hypothetical protein